MKNYIIILLLFAVASCSQSKQVTSIPDVSFTQPHIPTPNEIQPDTCFTNKQLRDYYKFVEKMTKLDNKKIVDSLKFELKHLKITEKTERIIIKFDNKAFSDSLNAVKSIYRDSVQMIEKVAKIESKEVIEALKQETKQLKIENDMLIKQNKEFEKTNRVKARKGWLFWVGLVFGLIISIFISKLKLW